MAALIASDCGLPELAQALCWRPCHAYLRAQPLGAQPARYALEPLVNVARLLIRGGQGESAYQLLDALYQAVGSRTDAVIDGAPLSFRDLTSSDDDHNAVCRWLWTVLLADGTRALAAADRWDQALAHAEQRGGVGRRLLDGRQVAVLAHCIAGDPATALAVLKDSAISTPWERCVAACLTVLCLRSGAQPADRAIAAMVELYLGLQPAAELLAFHLRLGLTVIDLAGGVQQPDAAEATIRVIDEAVAAGDGYAARDVLAHDGCRARLVDSEEKALSTAVQSSGLGRHAMPAHLMADLLSAVETSEVAASQHLAASAGWSSAGPT